MTVPSYRKVLGLSQVPNLLLGACLSRLAARMFAAYRAGFGPRDAGGFGLAVKLHVKDTSLPQAELSALAREAHEQVCPYSHATRGNVPVELSVEGG